MDDDHRKWRELILGREDLEDPTRIDADAHLAGCAECRALIERVRAFEGSRRPRGLLPPLEATVASMAPDLRAEADRSLQALRGRIGLPATRRRRHAADERFRSSWLGIVTGGPWRRLAVPLAMAAGVCVVALVASHERTEDVIRGLSVQPYAAHRGGVDSLAASARVGWRTGDAFVLAIDLASAAHPVVFHLGSDGEISLLHPADPGAPVPRLPAGKGLELPLPDAAETWIFEGSPGPETFIVAAAGRADPPLAEILAHAVALARERRPRQRLLAELVELLAADLGPVRTVEIEHLP